LKRRVGPARRLGGWMQAGRGQAEEWTLGLPLRPRENHPYARPSTLRRCWSAAS